MKVNLTCSRNEDDTGLLGLWECKVILKYDQKGRPIL